MGAAEEAKTMKRGNEWIVYAIAIIAIVALVVAFYFLAYGG